MAKQKPNNAASLMAAVLLDSVIGGVKIRAGQIINVTADQGDALTRAGVVDTNQGAVDYRTEQGETAVDIDAAAAVVDAPTDAPIEVA